MLSSTTSSCLSIRCSTRRPQLKMMARTSHRVYRNIQLAAGLTGDMRDMSQAWADPAPAHPPTASFEEMITAAWNLVSGQQEPNTSEVRTNSSVVNQHQHVLKAEAEAASLPPREEGGVAEMLEEVAQNHKQVQEQAKGSKQPQTGGGGGSGGGYNEEEALRELSAEIAHAAEDGPLHLSEHLGIAAAPAAAAGASSDDATGDKPGDADAANGQ